MSHRTRTSLILALATKNPLEPSPEDYETVLTPLLPVPMTGVTCCEIQPKESSCTTLDSIFPSSPIPNDTLMELDPMLTCQPHLPLLDSQNCSENTLDLPDIPVQPAAPREKFIPLESSCTISAGGKVSYAPIIQTQTDENISMELQNYFQVRDGISPNIVIEKDFNQNENCAEQQTFQFNDINNITNVQEIEESSDYEDNIPLINLIAAEKVISSVEESYTKKGTIRKRKRARTTEELNEEKEQRQKSLKEKHQVLAGCDINKCRKKCSSTFSETQRIHINRKFWQLTSQERKSYVLNSCDRLTVKKRRHCEDDPRKQNTFRYYLKTENDERRETCKVFFLTTLGFHKNNDRIVHDTLSKTPKGQFQPLPNMRGKAKNKYKIDDTVINEHIESFNPCISHYRREHAPNRRYLPSDISISSMHNDFVSKYPDLKVSYEAYRVKVKAKNISFAKLGNEECEICEEAKLHEHKKDDLREDCEICINWKRHIEHADKSRKLYQEQARSNFSDGTVCVSVDLQKIIMLPRIDTFKRIIFVQRLTTYHESFVPLGKKSNLVPFAVVWNESISGRNKKDIISTFYAFLLSQRDANRIIFWLDNCASQNKNWCFLTFLVRMVNSNEIAAQELIVNYFEPGHTFMSADSFHHQVELSLKRQGKTYDFDDFIQAVSTSRKSKIDVKPMTHNDFYLWKDFKSQAKLNQDLNHPRLSNIVQIKASRGKYILQYKTSLTDDEDFKNLDFLCKKAMIKKGLLLAPVASCSEPCGFPSSKKEKLLKALDGIIPENRKHFWVNLPESGD